MRLDRLFVGAQPLGRKIAWGDVAVIIGLGITFLALVKLSELAPHYIAAPHISTETRILPLYAFFSAARMFEAYVLSLLFTFWFGSKAAQNKRRERVMLPILDILQSVPILAYLPVFVMGLAAILPIGIAKEVAAVLLIFTSQAWNMTFSWYQSLTTIPNELREATSIFQLSPWMRFTTLRFPFAAIGLIWNSVMSWAGGWFALIASETFQVGNKNYELPGIGSYIKNAASSGNRHELWMGIATLAVVIVILDQFMWRPLLAWADKFRLDMVATEEPPRSWVYEASISSHIVRRFRRRIWRPLGRAIDAKMISFIHTSKEENPTPDSPLKIKLMQVLGIAVCVIGLFEISEYLSKITAYQWGQTGIGLLVTMLRVFLALVISLAWTIPVGYMIGTNAKLSRYLQPITQFLASFPATAVYPLFLLGFASSSYGVEVAALLLILAGTQWYLLFNVTAGVRAIPQDLRYTAQLMGLTGWQKWKTFILPALFPYIATGAITAAGGAWNASIFAEYQQYQNFTFNVKYGIGYVIANAQQANQYPLLMGATITMVLAVIVINRLVWRRVYRIAEERFRLE